ncbi:hypothetical protein TCEA9_22770 [Thermobrachium celere]|nr:hypothetical protein TCEA9_22770 [Thermobrachium celere]
MEIMAALKNKVKLRGNLVKYLVDILFVIILLNLSLNFKLEVFTSMLNMFYLISIYLFDTYITLMNSLIFNGFIIKNIINMNVGVNSVLFDIVFPFMLILIFHLYKTKPLKKFDDSKKIFRLALDKFNMPITLVDSFGKVVMYNKTFEELFLYEKNTNNILDVVEYEYLNEIKKVFTVAINKKVPSYTNVKLKQGLDYCTVIFHPLAYFNRKLYLCIIFNSINDAIASNMRRIIDELYKNEQNRTEFYANLTHELRTPINVILAALQMINLNLNREDNIQKYVQIMRQNCLRLLRLINNLIDTSKIDAGFLTLNLGNYNIVSIVENIVQSIVEYANTQGIEVIFDTDVEELIVACDPDKIERVLLNLLSNAIKFTPAGGNIFVNLTVKNEYVEVCVKDTGCGIPKEKLDVIFDRYKQVEDSTCKNTLGSGIGLSLVKGLIELHGGLIDVKSEIGSGSEFSFSLPIKTIDTLDDNEIREHRLNIEKIHVEFSDIYS